MRQRILFVAPRQSALAKSAVSDNHTYTRLLLLILIDAPFSPNLSRHSFRMAARIDNGRVQLLTRTGLNWTADIQAPVIERRGRRQMVARMT